MRGIRLCRTQPEGRCALRPTGQTTRGGSSFIAQGIEPPGVPFQNRFRDAACALQAELLLGPPLLPGPPYEQANDHQQDQESYHQGDHEDGRDKALGIA
jgi:hypothetical protein